MIDTKLQQELRQKYNQDGSTLRRAQLRMTEMLVFLDKVCSKYNLRYWIDSGTLLGACRHGGFIPWDDDTDVCMPLDDLHKLRKIMTTEHLSDEFVLQTPKNDKNYLRIEWCVLRDLKSEYIQDRTFHKIQKYRGLQVDVFPVEVGTNSVLMYILNAYQHKLMDKLINSQSISPSLSIPIIKGLRKLETSVLIPLCRTFNKKHSDTFSYAYGLGFYNRHKVSELYPLQKISFEGHMLNAPSNTDEYLKDLYGDWTKIPSENEIKTHEALIRFF